MSARSIRVRAMLAIIAVFACVLLPIAVLGESAWMVAFPLSTVAIFVYFHYSGSLRAESGLWPADPVRQTLAIGVGLGVCLFVLFKLVLEPSIELAVGTERDLSRLDPIRGSLPRMLGTLAIVWVTAAFYEELFYRGFLIRALAEMLGGTRWAWGVGVVVSATLFSVAHGYQGPAGLVITALGALALSAVYLQFRGNLWVPILAHGTFDSGTVILAWLGRYREVTGWIFG